MTDNLYYTPYNLDIYDDTTYLLDDGVSIISNTEPSLIISGSNQFILKENISNKVINIKAELINELFNLNSDINSSNIDINIMNTISNASLIINEYKKEQLNMINLENIYKQEIDTTQKSITSLNVYKNISSKLEYEYTNLHGLNASNAQDNIDNILSNIDELTNNIKNNNKLKTAKANYIASRLKMLSYFEYVKYINNDNVGTTCSLCYANNVNIYMVPCGHTICKNCTTILEMKNYDNCIFCRKKIESINPLYFV